MQSNQTQHIGAPIKFSSWQFVGSGGGVVWTACVGFEFLAILF